MQNQHNKKISEGFLYGAIFIAMLLLTMFIPSSELLTMFILPIPIAIYGYRYGWKSSSLLSVIILLIFSLFAFYFFIISLPIAVVTVLAGVFIGEAIKNKRHPYDTWGRATIGYAIGFLVLVLVLELMTDVSLATEYRLMIKESLESAQTLLQQTGISLSTEEVRLIERQMMVILDLLPSILIIGSMMYGLITQWLTYKTLNKWAGTKLYFPKFHSFQLPRTVLWMYLMVLILSWFSFGDMSIFDVAILNASAILAILFSIQGLSFIFYFLYKKGQPPIVSAIFVVLSLLFFPLGMYLTRILGIIDIGFLLKRRIK